MKRLFAFAVVLVMVLGVCSFSQADPASRLDLIREKGKLVVGTEAQYAPYEFKDLNAVDIGIAAFTRTDERAEVIDFSDLYETSLQYLIVKKGNEELYSNADALAGLKVGAQRGTVQSQLITKVFVNSELFELEKYPALALEVQNGNIAGLVADAAVGQSLVDTSNGALAVSNYAFTAEEASFGKACVVRKSDAEYDNTAFLEVVNAVIKRVVEDGSYTRVYDEAKELAASMGL